MTSKLLKLQATNAVSAASRKFTLLQIIELLEKLNITPKGNLTNTPKKILLMNSLKSAEDVAVRGFVREINGNLTTKKGNTNTHIDLHESFRGSKVEKFIESGDLEEAVRVAFVRINKRVKDMSQLTSDGASLMREAFSKNKPRLKINFLATQGELDEQEGIMHVFEGSMLAFRNPQSHDDEKKATPNEAFKILSLANYLMLILDKVTINRG